MAKSKSEKAPEAEKAPEGIQVTSNDDYMDMAAEAEKASDPYARKPKVKKSTLDGGVELEVYE